MSDQKASSDGEDETMTMDTIQDQESLDDTDVVTESAAVAAKDGDDGSAELTQDVSEDHETDVIKSVVSEAEDVVTPASADRDNDSAVLTQNTDVVTESAAEDCADVIESVVSEAEDEATPAAPPSPLSVPVNKEITIEDTIEMRQHQHVPPSEESLVVHVDDTQYDLDSDLGPSKSMLNSSETSLNGDGGAGNGEKMSPPPNGDTASGADSEETIAVEAEVQATVNSEAGKMEEVETTNNENKAKTSIENGSGESKPESVSKQEEKKTEKQPEKSPEKSSQEVAEKEKDLWVTNLGPTTRAADLKQIFSQYGKVVGAKVMTNAKIPGSLCYGYVTMASVEDAMKCIELLHKSEIQGRLVTVEKAKSLTLPGSKASKALKEDKPAASPAKSPASNRKEEKKERTEKEAEKKEDDSSKPETDSPSTKPKRATSPIRAPRSVNAAPIKKPSGTPIKKPSGTPIKSLMENPTNDDNARQMDRIKKQKEDLKRNEFSLKQDRQRLERAVNAHRLRTERDMRFVKEEKMKLRRDRFELNAQREQMGREKEEVNRMERERGRLERERRERERLENERESGRLHLEKMRIEEERRAVKRSMEDTWRGTGGGSGGGRRMSGEPAAKKSNFGEYTSPMSRKYESHGQQQDRSGRPFGAKSLAPKNNGMRQGDGRVMGAASSFPKMNVNGNNFARPRGVDSSRVGQMRGQKSVSEKETGGNVRNVVSNRGRGGKAEGSHSSRGGMNSTVSSFTKPQWPASSGPPSSVVAAGFVRGAGGRGGLARERTVRGGRGANKHTYKWTRP